MLATLMFALAPWALKGLINVFKNIHAIKLSPDRLIIVRFALAVFSFIVALLTAIVTGTPVPEDAFTAIIDALTLLLQTLITYFATSGLYFLKKNPVGTD
jgi:hypothetical protein